MMSRNHLKGKGNQSMPLFLVKRKRLISTRTHTSDSDESGAYEELPHEESDEEEFAEVKTWKSDLMGDAEDRQR